MKRSERKARSKVYRETHREELAAKQRAYRARQTPEQKARAREYLKRWNAENPKRKKEEGLLRSHGMTLAEWEGMAASQRYRCAICGKRTERLCVDHDHRTERRRALLCTQCNTALGMLRDRPELCEMAAQYLRQHKTYRFEGLLYVRTMDRSGQELGRIKKDEAEWEALAYGER